MSEELDSLEKINDAIAQLEYMFKETVELYYDNINIKEFIGYDYDSQRDLFVGRFIGQDLQPYSIEVNREGEPTLQKFDLTLWLKDSINRAFTPLTVKEIIKQEFKDEKFQGQFVGLDDASYDFEVTPFLAKTQIKKLDA